MSTSQDATAAPTPQPYPGAGVAGAVVVEATWEDEPATVRADDQEPAGADVRQDQEGSA